MDGVDGQSEQKVKRRHSEQKRSDKVRDRGRGVGPVREEKGSEMERKRK